MKYKKRKKSRWSFSPNRKHVYNYFLFFDEIHRT